MLRASEAFLAISTTNIKDVIMAFEISLARSMTRIERPKGRGEQEYVCVEGGWDYLLRTSSKLCV